MIRESGKSISLKRLPWKELNFYNADKLLGIVGRLIRFPLLLCANSIFSYLQEGPVIESCDLEKFPIFRMRHSTQ